MSSSITIPKICFECSSAFIAKTTVTKFCSQKCAGRAYKKNKRKEKVPIFAPSFIGEVYIDFTGL